MIHKISMKLAERIGIKSNMESDMVEVAAYGFEVAIEMLLNILALLAIGGITGLGKFVWLFLALYMPLRTCAGGFHASNYTKCFILSILIILLLIAVIQYCPVQILFVASIVMAVISIPMIMVTPPVENHNKKISLAKSKKYQRRTRIVVMCQTVLWIVLHSLGLHLYGFTVAFTLFAVFILGLMGKYSLKKGRESQNTVNQAHADA